MQLDPGNGIRSALVLISPCMNVRVWHSGQIYLIISALDDCTHDAGSRQQSGVIVSPPPCACLSGKYAGQIFNHKNEVEIAKQYTGFCPNGPFIVKQNWCVPVCAAKPAGSARYQPDATCH